jgi:hypothetical protein
MRRSLVLSLGFVCALFVLSLGTSVRVWGEPGLDQCTNYCQEKIFFIADKLDIDDDPRTCHQFDPPDCAWCKDGRCVDPWGLPSPLSCEANSKPNTIKKYAPGSCTAYCTLNKGSFSQALMDTSAEPFTTWNATQLYCLDKTVGGGEN